MKRDLIMSARASACLCFAAGLSLVALQSSVSAEPASPSPATQQATSGAGSDSGKSAALRVCASANQAPFSERGGGGFENKIADAVGNAMGRPVDFVWTDKPAIYLVRDFLDKRACDVIIGMDTGDPRVLTTKPYYRAGYVFITKVSEPEIHSWKDPRLKTFEHIAVQSGTPGEMMLKEIGKYDDEFNYEKSLVNFRSARNQYIQVSPERLVSEVAEGKAQVAVGFSPEVARYVREASPPLKMTPVDNDTFMTNGTRIPETFDQSMGVRKGDTKLLTELDEALVKAKPQIEQILKAEGIPPASS